MCTDLDLADPGAFRQVDALGLRIAWQLVKVVNGGGVPGWGILLQVPKLQHEALQGCEQSLHLGVPV